MAGLDIAFVSSHHPSVESMGSSHVVSFLGREIARRGHRVRVFYPERPGLPTGPSRWGGMEAQLVPGESLRKFPFGPEFGFSQNVARELPDDLDVVVVNNEQGGAPVIRRARAMQRSNGGRRPLTVGVLHGLSLRMLEIGRALRPRTFRPRVGYYLDWAFLWWLEGRGASLADVCVAPSAAVREELLETYHLRPSHVQVIYNGTEARPLRSPEERRKAREALGLDPRNLYLLFIARDHYRKGLDIARETVGLLRSGGLPVTLLNVGNGQPSSEGVRSLGSVSPEVKDQLIAACDAFFLPTRYEGYPIVIQEAAAVGVPVVTTPAAHVEIGTSGRDYLAVEPNTPEAHARALRSLLQDPPRLEQMGREGRAAQAMQTYARQATAYLELFERGLSGEFYPTPYHPIPYRWTREDPAAAGPAPGSAPALSRAPYLSVVVLGWKRQGYIRGAVESVLRTSFPRDDVEVLVIKGFEEPELDGWLSSQGVRVVYCPEAPSGPKHALGIELARGEVICWLDDDDEFTPEKLPSVASVFREHPDISFFHHAHQRMDLLGRPQGPGTYIPDFNCSSMAVRRRAAQGLRMGLLAVNGICDTLQYYEMMALGRRIYEERDSRLTRYRVALAPNPNFDVLPAYATLARQVRDLGRGRDHRKALASVLRIYFSTLVRTPCYRRAEAAELLTIGLRSLSIRPFLPDLREVVCATLHPFSPELSRGVYTFLRRGKVDWLTPHPGPSPGATPRPQ
ncbi:MAG: glycosyltransferase [Euryarchaeota archaeon]|nr:glycosyltransferase [Euryarchaeota archaeon]MDE1837737.1 glycosyltransferase [Euryarchaeota archaeon]MDE1880937.1 glycosyltransferase [Euryarchaeota archaeon]MDE2046100.1 glycosyltransferase [Thermoplasmata archaeon]